MVFIRHQKEQIFCYQHHSLSHAILFCDQNTITTQIQEICITANLVDKSENRR